MSDLKQCGHLRPNLVDGPPVLCVLSRKHLGEHRGWDGSEWTAPPLLAHRHVRFTTELGNKTILLIDGLDVANATTGLQLRAGVGSVPVVELEMLPGKLEIDANADVTVNYSLAVALIGSLDAETPRRSAGFRLSYLPWFLTSASSAYGPCPAAPTTCSRVSSR